MQETQDDTVLGLTPDVLLTATRSVRRRLDLTRPVPRPVIQACLAVAQQAPSASNAQHWHFVVVTDPARRAALAAIYRRGWEIYQTLPIYAGNLVFDDPGRDASQRRVVDSGQYLADHLHEVPVHVVPCLPQRLEGQPAVLQSASWGTIAPAAWSFMLAARARGLGTCWTSLHLFGEEEAAAVLGIPYAEVTQASLIPVAYTTGGGFKAGLRAPLDTVVHWETW